MCFYHARVERRAMKALEDIEAIKYNNINKAIFDILIIIYSLSS